MWFGNFLFQIIVRKEYRCPDTYQRNTLVFTFLKYRTGFCILQIGKISFSYPNAVFTQSEFIRTFSKNPKGAYFYYIDKILAIFSPLKMQLFSKIEKSASKIYQSINICNWENVIKKVKNAINY